MTDKSSSTELHHEIFGSTLDRTEMTPYLLLSADNYSKALLQASQMLKNRGFDVVDGYGLLESERHRAKGYIAQSCSYFSNWLLPTVKSQLEKLAALNSANGPLYRNGIDAIAQVEGILADDAFRSVTDEDPRHLFLLASSKRYPHLFFGYRGKNVTVPAHWQQAACAILKMGFLIKSIEEDSQDINDYAQLGFFLATTRKNLHDLFQYEWENPSHIPSSEPAQIAYVKIATFFHKLKESIVWNESDGCFVFDSGDGVQVDIVDIRARLKSPESMVIKLGKNLEGESYDIRDILAITFVLKHRDDTLKLFHALQKKGVILQENTNSLSITQTLFDSPRSMIDAVGRLMTSLSKSAHHEQVYSEAELLAHGTAFYEALSQNARKNTHTSPGHRKFQCQLSFSLPIHREAETHKIIIPGTATYARRGDVKKTTQQQTLGVELRISDAESWKTSEQKGDAHHDAYKFRQLIAVMNRIFKHVFHMPPDCIDQLRKDQAQLF
ncbi:MAG: hypothetical protein JXX14_08750 [Deltaproteobacteria bacterium]|nr:hypothetical protein [Deltaproteobacteria bacterium]